MDNRFYGSVNQSFQVEGMQEQMLADGINISPEFQDVHNRLQYEYQSPNDVVYVQPASEENILPSDGNPVYYNA